MQLKTVVQIRAPQPLIKEGGILQTETATGLAAVVTGDMLSGVLDEIVGLLPIVFPVMIGFIALRKGISFVLNSLHSA